MPFDTFPLNFKPLTSYMYRYKNRSSYAFSLGIQSSRQLFFSINLILGLEFVSIFLSKEIILALLLDHCLLSNECKYCKTMGATLAPHETLESASVLEAALEQN